MAKASKPSRKRVAGKRKMATVERESEANVQRQELWCHECSSYVQFNLDISLNGKHVLNCPKCGHEHCRIVKDGVISEDRWDRRNGSSTPGTSSMSVIYATNVAWTTASTFNSTSATNSFFYDSWINSSGSTGNIVYSTGTTYQVMATS